ncbi:MAG: hypothetical protein JKP98_24445 [Rhodobacteraceae bacterium]|nr:hypothetical protein [Paracoccaceae bacterium]
MPRAGSPIIWSPKSAGWPMRACPPACRYGLPPADLAPLRAALAGDLPGPPELVAEPAASREPPGSSGWPPSARSIRGARPTGSPG